MLAICDLWKRCESHHCCAKGTCQIAHQNYVQEESNRSKNNINLELFSQSRHQLSVNVILCA